MHAVQSSISSEIRWRVDLYTRCFEHCRTGRFSLARFLALIPDRLRLVTGQRGIGVRIPVTIEPALSDLWADSFGARSAAFVRTQDPKELRRTLRIAQLDPELDPLALLGWLRERGDPILASLGHLYRRALSEVGRGEGGEEAAYLVHMVATEQLARAIPSGEVSSRLLAFALVQLAQGVLLASEETASISARLGYLFQATLTPFALGADEEQLARRHLNCYRTTAEAVELAQRVIQEPVEMIPLRRVVGTIARRLSLDPEVAPVLRREVLLEMIRDASMLALLQLQSPLPVLAEVCRSEQALLQHVLNERRRKILLDAISARAPESPKAIAALTRLLAAVGAVEAGDPRPLGLHGGLDARAELAAAGAVALVLDGMVDRLKRDVTALVQEVPEDEWRQGRAYRIALEEAPLYRLAEGRPQAMLLADLSEAPSVAARVAELAHRPDLAIEPSRAGAVVLRGDVVAVVELVLQLLRIAGEQPVDPGSPARDVLGGTPRRLDEVRAESAALAERIATVDAAIRRTSDRESLALLVDGKSMLEKQLGLLREIASELGTPKVSIPMVVALGELTERDAHHAIASADWIEAERALALESARVTRGDEVAAPFLASIRARARLDLPADLIQELAEAAGEPTHVASVASKMAQWLRGEIDKRVLSPSALLAWTDPCAEIHNRGAVLTGAALRAWRRAKSPALWFAERSLVSSELPEEIARRWVFDRDPERLLVARRAEDRTAVAIFRYVGEASLGAGPSIDLWELVRLESRFGEDVIRLESPGDTHREWS